MSSDTRSISCDVFWPERHILFLSESPDLASRSQELQGTEGQDNQHHKEDPTNSALDSSTLNTH